MSDTSGDNPDQPDGKQIVESQEKPPQIDELSVEEIEEERQRRLAPENRPDNVEVDNTQRDFDPIKGTFEDVDGESAKAPFEDPSESA